MKCPYRIKKEIYKGVSHGAYCLKSNDVCELFEECYGRECPLFVDNECVRAKSERSQ